VKRISTALLLGGLALVAVAGCGGESHSSPKPAGGTAAASGAAAAQTFTVHGNDRDQFQPGTIEAKVGTLTLTLQNGGVPHNLTFKDKALPTIGAVSGAATRSARLVFDKAGTYVFECTIHPGMEGKVVVTP
jgi:plastocyanin